MLSSILLGGDLAHFSLGPLLHFIRKILFLITHDGLLHVADFFLGAFVGLANNFIFLLNFFSAHFGSELFDFLI